MLKTDLGSDSVSVPGRFYSAFLALCCVLAVSGASLASDYDWRDPGKEETEAVLSCLLRGDLEALDALLDDGLGVDQLLPLERDRVPLLSLALSAGRIGLVEHLLEEGADVDTMSTRDVRRTERVQHSVKVRTR